MVQNVRNDLTENLLLEFFETKNNNCFMSERILTTDFQ